MVEMETLFINISLNFLGMVYKSEILTILVKRGVKKFQINGRFTSILDCSC